MKNLIRILNLTILLAPGRNVSIDFLRTACAVDSQWIEPPIGLIPDSWVYLKSCVVEILHFVVTFVFLACQICQQVETKNFSVE